MATKVLFVCSQNKLRSPTAEHIFSRWETLECDSAGLNRGADVELSSEQVQWADVIFVMERQHRNKLSRRFKKHLNGKRLIVLSIPDDYEFMAPELIDILEAKVPQFLR